MGGPRADTHTNDNTTPSLERRSRGAPLFIYLFLFYYYYRCAAAPSDPSIDRSLVPEFIHKFRFFFFFYPPVLCKMEGKSTAGVLDSTNFY
jgi:hypothetical protein